MGLPWTRFVAGGACVAAGVVILTRATMLALGLLGVGIFLLLWPKDASNDA